MAKVVSRRQVVGRLVWIAECRQYRPYRGFVQPGNHADTAIVRIRDAKITVAPIIRTRFVRANIVPIENLLDVAEAHQLDPLQITRTRSGIPPQKGLNPITQGREP